MCDSDLERLPRNYIKAEMQKRELKAHDMIELLKNYDENLNLQSFHNKISRGSFSATFFFKCMCAMGVTKVEF